MCGSVWMSNEYVKTGGPSRRTDGHGSILQRNELCSVCVRCVDGESARGGVKPGWVYARERLDVQNEIENRFSTREGV